MARSNLPKKTPISIYQLLIWSISLPDFIPSITPCVPFLIYLLLRHTCFASAALFNIVVIYGSLQNASPCILFKLDSDALKLREMRKIRRQSEKGNLSYLFWMLIKLLHAHCTSYKICFPLHGIQKSMIMNNESPRSSLGYNGARTK